MAIYRNDVVTIDLENGNIHRSFMAKTIGEGDILANRFGVNVLRDKTAVDLTGSTCTGYFVRSSGDTVVVSGTVSGNTAYVDLPESCYAVEGQFSLAIKLTGGGITGTMRIVDGVVSNTTTSSIVDPGTLVPSIEDLIEAIDEAVAAIPSDYSELSENVDKINGWYYDENMAWLANISGKYIDNNGEEASNSNLRCSDYIKIPGDVVGVQIYVNYNGSSTFNPVAALYNSSKEFISVITNADAVDGIKTYYFYSFEPAYIRVTQSDKTVDQSNCLVRFIRSTQKLIQNKQYAMGVATNFNLNDNAADFHNLEPNKIYSKFGNTNSPANPPYTNWRGNLFTLYGTTTQNADNSGMRIIAISDKNEIHVCGIWGSTWSDWMQIDPQTYGYVGEFSVTPTQKEKIMTSIRLTAGERYLILNKSPNPQDLNLFIYGYSSDSVKMNPSDNAVDFTPQNSGYLVVYNIRENLDPIHLVAYKMGSILQRSEFAPEVFYVSKSNAAGTYTSLTQCLLDLKDDEQEKIIYVDGGEYDLFQEYADAGVPVYTGDDPTMDFFDYCVWVPRNTHIIGRGVVKLIWMPDAEDTTIPQSKTVSPLNTAGNCTIENIEIHGKNCRYCLHNDALGAMKYYDSVQRFINVKFYKYQHQNKDNDYLGFAHTIGFGIDADMRHEYINCEFYNEESTGQAFYGHNRNISATAAGNTAHSPTIICENCIMISQNEVTARFDSATNVGGFRIPTKLMNCYMNHNIRLKSSENINNAYDLTLLNCTFNDIVIDDANNPYPVHVYPPRS